MKRLGILMLALVMCVAVMPYARAEYTRESFYEMGLSALENMDAESAALAADHFSAASGYMLAPSYLLYAQSLQEILSPDAEGDIGMAIYRLQLLQGFPQYEEFASSVAEHHFPSCPDLIVYAQGQQYEKDGDYAQARRKFQSVFQVLDAMQRIVDLTPKAYEQGKRLLEEGRYSEALTAFEGLKWQDSEALYQQAYAVVHPAPTPTPTPAPTPEPTPTPTPAPTPEPTPTPKPISVTKDSYIFFGHYPQTAAGTDNTPIEWLVLEVDEANHRALLLSRYGLDAQPYNKQFTDITWEKCTLRTWLNSTFMNKAFTAQEQMGILLTHVDNSRGQGYSRWSTSGGNNTQDKIFLLSCAEANKYLGVTLENTNNTKSRVRPTAYALKRGAETSINSTNYETADGKAAGWWWLRSPGGRQEGAADVHAGGSLLDHYVTHGDGCVRPALWINLDSDIF